MGGLLGMVMPKSRINGCPITIIVMLTFKPE